MNKYKFYIEVTNRATNEELVFVVIAPGNSWFDAWHTHVVNEIKHKDAYKYDLFQVETVK